LSYVSTSGRSDRKPGYSQRPRGGGVTIPGAYRSMAQLARQEVPPPPGMRRRRIWVLASFVMVIISAALPLLLLVALPVVVMTLVALFRNLKGDLIWYEQYRAALADIKQRHGVR
jgi:hypothetical protein